MYLKQILIKIGAIMTKFLQTIIVFLIVYFSFIDVIPFFYWLTTGLYVILGACLIVGAICLHSDNNIYTIADVKKQYSIWQKYKLLNIVKLTLLTLVLVATHNFYHLVFVFSILYFYYELTSAYNRYFR